jgi:hypothetical protein
LKGILAGVYFGFKTNEYIIPDLSPSSEKDASSYFLSYKFYSDLIAYLSSNKSIPRPKFKRNETNRLSIDTSNSLTKETPYAASFSTEDLNRGSVIIDDINNYEYQNEEEIFEEQKNGDELDEEESPESNSKLESELNEIIELVVRDYILRFLDKIVLENDRFVLITK